MLLSLSRRFIFVANLKTASTSIEACLRPFSEICIPRTEFGKHASFGEIEARYSWAFNYIKLENFRVFGVIRDPVDYMLSIYNSHKKPAFMKQPSYTGEKSFEQFYEQWKANNSWQLQPQYKRFLNAKAEFALDFLLNLDDLPEGWSALCEILGVPQKELRNLNVSPLGAQRADIDSALIAQIYAEYATDRLLAEKFTGLTASRVDFPLPVPA